MIDFHDELLKQLADDFVDLHKCGGIELEHWDTAKRFVDEFYRTKSITRHYVEIGQKRTEPCI